jgi:peptidoglycan endopeptidase LytE
VYKVRSGDTLEKIARSHDVSIDQIRRWNRLSSSRIYPGQELTIYPDATASSGVAAKEETGKPTNNTTLYKVRKGDTLWDIARAHNVGESDLKAWNKLKANKIYAGQELVIHQGRENAE